MRNDFCSNYLEHSAKGSTWKKGTKYIDKVWSKGRWVYRYKITGEGYKNEADVAKKRSQNDVRDANLAKKEGRSTAYNNLLRYAETDGKKAAKAEYNYSTKSVKGNVERGLKTISKLLKPGKDNRSEALKRKSSKSKTTETIKDTFTGKTKKANHSGETINVKQAAEKNKKVVSDDGKTKVTVSSNISPKKKKKK